MSAPIRPAEPGFESLMFRVDVDKAVLDELTSAERAEIAAVGRNAAADAMIKYFEARS